MQIDVNEIDVVNNVEDGRFEMHVGSKVAFAEYNLAGKNIVFPHTVVPPEFEGQGVGGKIVVTALNYARDNELTVIPLCPFFAAFIRKNAEYQPLVMGYSG